MDKLEIIQLFRDGKLDIWTLAELLDVPNMNERESIVRNFWKESDGKH